jgi:putative membrane-bound dehydrogenase-like protein
LTVSLVALAQPAFAQNQNRRPPETRPAPQSIFPAPEDPRHPTVVAGWKVETVLMHPNLANPSCVCTLPDGRILVAEDPMNNYGHDGPGDRILCIFPDGHVTEFANHLFGVYGLAYLDGKVYVHHMPRFTVFTDDNGVGKDPVELFTQTNVYKKGLTDHLPSQIRLAMDGFFYMTTGDRGIWGAKSTTDGSAINLKGGGIARFRPDGSGLEIFATGTRNHLDVSVNAEDDMFTLDNTDDGHGWWTRFTHMIDGGFYGYPWDYKPAEQRAAGGFGGRGGGRGYQPANPDQPYQPYTLWRIAETGGGSATGAIAYNEDALPEEYRGSLFHSDWGKNVIDRFVVKRDGGTFKLDKMEAFLQGGGQRGEFRPLGLAVSVDGRSLYVCDWGYGGWLQSKESGRLLKVTWTGQSLAAPKPAWFAPAGTAKPFTATTEELIAGLRHPAESVRLVAQRRVGERGQAAVAPLLALLNDTKAPAFARWSAIWTLDRIDNGKGGHAAIINVAKNTSEDAAVRRQAMRELGTRHVTEATDALVAGLNDSDGSIRMAAAIGLGRIGNPAAVPAIISKLEEKDLFVRFSLFTALNRIGRAQPGSWALIVKGLDNKSAAIRANTSYGLRNTYDPELVKALTQMIDTAATTTTGRQAAIAALADLHRHEKEWDGSWWATQPAGQPRPAKNVEWSGTQQVLDMLRKALNDSDPAIRLAAVKGLMVAPDPQADDALIALFNKETDVPLRASILEALATTKSPKAGELVAALVNNPAANGPLLEAAIEVLGQTGGKLASDTLTALISNKAVDTATTLKALTALGKLKDRSTVEAVAKLTSSTDEQIAAAAVAALGSIGSGQAADGLIAALSDQRPAVRRAAAEALGTMPNATAAIPALTKALEDSDNATANAAVSALTRMPTMAGLDAYLGLLDSTNASWRDRAKRALTTLAPRARTRIEEHADAKPFSPQALAILKEIYLPLDPDKTGKLFQIADKPTTRPDRDTLATFAMSHTGDVSNGKKLFGNLQTLGCIRCHQTGTGEGGNIGPSLQGIATKYDKAKIIESVIYPSKQILDGYEQWGIGTNSGDVQWGIIRGEDDNEVTMYDSAANKIVIKKSDIRLRRKSPLSLMPEGLEQSMSPQEFTDLISYLESLKEKPVVPTGAGK